MFKAIRRIGLRLRLEVFCIKHERSAHRRHRADADLHFDIFGLASEITKSEHAVEKEVNGEFGHKLSEAAAQEVHASSALTIAEDNQRLLQRDFKSELDPLYDELARLRQLLSEAYEEKSAAYERLSSAKSSLDSWYAKSDRTFFGNKGKQLPEHAFFGQDLSDRDRHKGQRDSAASDLDDAKRNIARLKGRKSEVGAQIAIIKQDRARMHELRDRRLNRKTAAEHVADCKSSVAAAISATQKVRCARSCYEADLSEQHKLIELRTRLIAMQAQREAFLKTFAAPDEKAKRRSEAERLFNEQNRV